MIKSYKANTNISINIVLASKKNLHVSFVPLSNGSSVFTTDREEVQNAIESHYKFGKLFVLSSTQESPNKQKQKVTTTKHSSTSENGAKTDSDNNTDENPEAGNPKDEDENPNDNNSEDENPEEEGENSEGENDDAKTESDDNSESNNGLKKVTVSDIATAKDYLAEHCGVSRTTMRSTKSILEHALANGIEFVGI